MAKGQMTRRQKNISRLLREKRQKHKDTLKTHNDGERGRRGWRQ